jgi:predicted helicase
MRPTRRCPSSRPRTATTACPPWDLAVIDEADRASGKLGRPWAAIHADAAVPAVRRLYMTATPRIVDETGAVVASMDDEAIYGPVAWRLGLGDAIRAGILADYRIAVPAVDGRQAAALIRSSEILAAEGGPAVPADAIATCSPGP